MAWTLRATHRGSTPRSGAVRLYVGGEMPDGVVDEDDIAVGHVRSQRGFVTLTLEMGGEEIVVQFSHVEAEEVARELSLTAAALRDALPSGLGS